MRQDLCLALHRPEAEKIASGACVTYRAARNATEEKVRPYVDATPHLSVVLKAEGSNFFTSGCCRHFRGKPPQHEGRA